MIALEQQLITHATARWLQRLGCKVRGFPLTSNFQVEDKTSHR